MPSWSGTTLALWTLGFENQPLRIYEQLSLVAANLLGGIVGPLFRRRPHSSWPIGNQRDIRTRLCGFLPSIRGIPKRKLARQKPPGTTASLKT